MKNATRQSALVVFLSVVAAACTGCGSDPAAPVDLSKFVGKWNVVTADLTVTCSNDTVETIPVTDPTIFTLGTTSDLLDTGPVCPLRYDVAGHIATAVAGQSCSNPMVVAQIHVTGDTFATTDGVAATHHGSGRLSAFIDLSKGSPVSCTWTEAGTYQRASP